MKAITTALKIVLISKPKNTRPVETGISLTSQARKSLMIKGIVDESYSPLVSLFELKSNASEIQNVSGLVDWIVFDSG